jgi:hypothetical protein
VSARHRQAKKKLCALREERARLQELSDAYSLVRLDTHGHGISSELAEFHNYMRDELDEVERAIAKWELPE